MANNRLTEKWADKLIPQRKRDLRSFFRQRAELFQAHQSAFHVERFNEALVTFMRHQGGTWGAFRAHGFEPRLDKAIYLSPHIQWVYPKMQEEQLVFVDSNEFGPGRFGIEEPRGGKVVALKDIQGFLVPGTAFDRKGGRLGRGRGYYDRVLNLTAGLRVGVCFSFQIFEGLLPNESFDVKMEALVSEQGLQTFGE